MNIHQMLPAFFTGDAIGNQALEVRRLLRASGHNSEIFAEHRHESLTSQSRFYKDYAQFSNKNNLLLLHYAIGSVVNQFSLDLPDRTVIYYHNITPSRFFYNYNGELARHLDQSRKDLSNLAGKVPAIAASEYNRDELVGLGFEVIGVAPYIVLFDQLLNNRESPGAASLRAKFEKKEFKTWLYVGRMAPNKCIEDIIKSFFYYHTYIEPQSRLLLVGVREGYELYVEMLNDLIRSLKLDDAVVFCGNYSAAQGLAAFYDMADLYVCMSEHEGFCVPLTEAMKFDLPVLAFSATGVPYTMGDAGILAKKKDYAAIAEMADEMIVNTSMRQRIIERQRERLKAFDPHVARLQVLDTIQLEIKS